MSSSVYCSGKIYRFYTIILQYPENPPWKGGFWPLVLLLLLHWIHPSVHLLFIYLYMCLTDNRRAHRIVTMDRASCGNIRIQNNWIIHSGELLVVCSAISVAGWLTVPTDDDIVVCTHACHSSSSKGPDCFRPSIRTQIDATHWTGHGWHCLCLLELPNTSCPGISEG